MVEILLVLNYNNTFNEKHNLNLIGGHSWQSVSYDGFRAEARNIDPFYEDVQSNNLQAYSQIEWGYVSSYRSIEEGLASVFSRAIYDFWVLSLYFCHR